MVAELTKPMMRAAMYCEAPTCSTPFSVDLQGISYLVILLPSAHQPYVEPWLRQQPSEDLCQHSHVTKLMKSQLIERLQLPIESGEFPLSGGLP